MAVTDVRRLQPRWPDIDRINWQRARFDYHEESDTLYWDFLNETRSAVSLPYTDNIMLSVDPRSEEVVGFQFDAFTTRRLDQMSELVPIADILRGAVSGAKEPRSRLDPLDSARRQRQALRGLLGLTNPLAPSITPPAALSGE